MPAGGANYLGYRCSTLATPCARIRFECQIQHHIENHMKNLINRTFTYMALLAVFALTLPAQAKDRSEDELIAEMGSPNEDTAASAMLAYEKQYPTSTKAFPTMKKV